MYSMFGKDHDEELTFTLLVQTLCRLDGITVVAPVQGVGSGSRFTAAGVFRVLDVTRAAAFTIGDRFVIVLAEEDFIGAELHTFEGNAYFWLALQFGSAKLVIGSPEHLGTDYEGF